MKARARGKACSSTSRVLSSAAWLSSTPLSASERSRMSTSRRSSSRISARPSRRRSRRILRVWEPSSIEVSVSRSERRTLELSGELTTIRARPIWIWSPTPITDSTTRTPFSWVPLSDCKSRIRTPPSTEGTISAWIPDMVGSLTRISASIRRPITRRRPYHVMRAASRARSNTMNCRFGVIERSRRPAKYPESREAIDRGEVMLTCESRRNDGVRNAGSSAQHPRSSAPNGRCISWS